MTLTAEHTWVPTERDREILRILAAGYTVNVVARRVGLSERSVRRRLRSMAETIGVGSTMELVVCAVRRRVI
jgi:DNA-binding NarL/FixJ family response regulator